MKAGCYTLDLYCDTCMSGRVEFTGETFAECRRQAKKQGWVVGNWTLKAKEYCPECAKAAKP